MFREALAEQGFCCCRIHCFISDNGTEMVQKHPVFEGKKLKSNYCTQDKISCPSSMRTVLNLGVNLVGCWDAEQWDWGWSWPLCVSPLQHGEGQTSPHSPFVPLRAPLGKQGFIILWPPQIPGNATTCQCPATAGIGIPNPK